MIKIVQESYSPSHPTLFAVDFHSKSRSQLRAQKARYITPFKYICILNIALAI